MKLTKIEKEILEKAFDYVNSYYPWEDEYEPEYYFNKVEPKIKELAKKLGIEL